jgi:TPR repeat protein
VDGWTNDQSPQTFYTLDFLNPEATGDLTSADSGVGSTRHVAMLFEDTSKEQIIMGFEDLNRVDRYANDYGTPPTRTSTTPSSRSAPTRRGDPVVRDRHRARPCGRVDHRRSARHRLHAISPPQGGFDVTAYAILISFCVGLAGWAWTHSSFDLFGSKERECFEAVRGGASLTDASCLAAEQQGSGRAGFLRASAGLSDTGLDMAAEDGLAPALTVRAMPVLRRSDATDMERDAAIADLRVAAGQGYAPAQLWLAVVLLEGEEGSAREPEAADLLKRAAFQGSADAQFLLAGLYRTGRGVIADRQRMRDLYLEAAQRGHAAAAFNLAADLFDLGQQDRARTWVRRSAAGGFAPALTAMATFSERDGDLPAAAVYHSLAARFSAGQTAKDAQAASTSLMSKLGEADRAFVEQRIVELEGAIRAGRS